MAGLYIHVPFCAGKCPYCDFYSLDGCASSMDAYTRRACTVMEGWGGGAVDTVYFGGGTPSLLGAGRLGRLLEGAKKSFTVAPGAEVTVEANPTHIGPGFFEGLRLAGFNRLSMGLQSAHEDELRLLGRGHTPAMAARAVGDARAAGFCNISLDMMLGLPGGSREKLRGTVDFIAGLGVQHVSAYILKIEPGTAFARDGVALPGDDEVADQYLFCVRELERRGFYQYEISNFAKPGFMSRHNLTYWRGEEYAGIGPGAHSFWKGRRFYYPRDLQVFLAGGAPVDDGPGGDFEEFAMLRLRLTQGLLEEDCRGRFGAAGAEGFSRVRRRAAGCPPGLVGVEEGRVFFTPEGFLVSNALLIRLLGG